MERITFEEKTKLESIYQRFLNDPKIKRLKEIRMHRGSNVYIHSFKVAKVAIKRAIRRKKQLDLEAILVASILHDYYLYDWRKNRELKKKHASSHPKTAAINARRDFEISDKVESIILSHMWPINFRTFPDSTEARIVANADNVVANKEVITSINFKSKRMDFYYKSIEKLFD